MKEEMRIAFWGRSNVGKSTLINALIKKNSVARVSKKPGCTKSIDSFTLKKGMELVDLPGYGYASVSKAKSHNWDREIRSYLLEEIDMTFLLIDARHKIKNTDLEHISWMEQIPFQIVLTKAKTKEAILDKEKMRSQLSTVIKEFGLPEPLETDAKKNHGVNQLRSLMENLPQQ